MANLTPTPGWDNVFQLETDTPVLGGAGGVANSQAQALLNRTSFLEGATGSSKVGHTPEGTDAVPTTVQTELNRQSVTPDRFYLDTDPDDTNALNRAIAHCLATGKQLVGIRTYTISSTVNFRFIPVDFSGATIDVAHAGIGILIGGNANAETNPPQSFGIVTRSVGTDTNTTPSIRCIGAKGQRISVELTRYFQIYADTHSVGEQTLRDLDYSTAYSTFTLKRVNTIELTNNPANAGGPVTQNPGGTIQWINENTFFLNRSSALLVNGTYQHNHNHFYHGTFENSVTIDFDVGFDNHMYGCRFENGPTTITFGTNAARNYIENTWDQSEFTGAFNPVVSGTVTDNGFGNVVYDLSSIIYRTAVIAKATIGDFIVNNQAGEIGPRVPQLQRIVAGNNTNVVASDYQLAIQDDIYSFEYSGFDSGDTIRYRATIRFFAKDLTAIIPTTDFLATPNLTTISGNSLTQGAGATSAVARLTKAAIDAGVVFVKALVVSSNGQLGNALARQIQIVRRSKTAINEYVDGRHNYPAASVTAIPTQGFVPAGWSCVDTDGLSIYINTFALETTLTAGALLGATTISIATGTGTVNGDIIGINMDNRDTHWTTIASGGGTTSITLTVGLPAAAASGSRVVFNRWVTK